MYSPEEAKLVKNALEHYKSRLEEFKRKKRDEIEFHSSMFPDIDKEIKRVEDIMSKIGDDPHPYPYGGSEAETMARALETYGRDLAKITKELEESFPKIGSREMEKLDEKIKRLRNEFPKS